MALTPGTPVKLGGNANLWVVVRPENSRGAVQISILRPDRFSTPTRVFRPAAKLAEVTTADAVCLCGTAPHFRTSDCK